MLKIYILIAVIGLVGGVVYGGYYYYKDTQSRIQTLTENSARLEAVTEEQNNTIDVLIKDQEKFEELNRELQTSLDKANEYKDVLIGKLRKHDLAKLSMQKPSLIEKRINNGTKKLFQSLEDLTTIESSDSSTSTQ
tara:strand:- start:871 stop:1278 length:408 start_codon:yes stop_codon:yes gene_type:complete